jgi:hypothetical protein
MLLVSCVSPECSSGAAPDGGRAEAHGPYATIASGMDLKAFIEWTSHDLGSAVATIFPYLLVGLVALYVLWLVVGYLRVSQVGIAAEAPAGPRALPAPSGPGATTVVRPRGVPYCPVDQLQFSPGAGYCTRCEGDLLVDCANCGTTIRAADPSCFHCGTRATQASA